MILDEHLTAAETRAVEFNANYLGVPNLTLMENAGRAVADAVASHVAPGGRVLVACGTGGNGGDGFVVARHLAARGFRVEAVLVGHPEQIRGEETRRNFEVADYMTTSLKLRFVSDSFEVTPVEADAVVDALIGYTYRGGLPPTVREMVNAINDSSAFKVSVDVPTGMVADTGEVPEECVEADLTVTFHKPKAGYVKKPRHLGRLATVPIGIPLEAELYTGPGDVLLAHRRRAAESHKGMFGRLLVVGGSETYHGAPALTSLGASAVGIDLCYTAVPEPAAQAVASMGPSMIVVKLKGDRLSPENLGQLEPFLGKVNAVAFGPGLGLADETREATKELVRMVEARGLPAIIDADALKAFGEEKRKIRVPTVFTPHAREFEILTGVKAEGGHLEKGAIVAAEAARLGAVILLKGSVDVVSDGAHTRYNWTGNPGMTVGGTGDVLTGITAGYVAQGVVPMQAACAAAFLNGAAGDAVLAEKGYHIQPGDLIPKIPLLVEEAVSGRMRLS